MITLTSGVLINILMYHGNYTEQHTLLIRGFARRGRITAATVMHRGVGPLISRRAS